MYNKSENIKKVASIAMFSAMAFTTRLLFKIPVGFLTLDVKDAIITLGGLIFGPLSGIIIALITSLLEFIISETGPIGLVMNFVSSGTFVGVASFIYKFRRNVNGAIIGLFSSVIATTAVMLLMNIFLTPIYQGVARSAVIALIPTLFFPFNFAKTLLNSSIVMFIYKPIVTALRKAKIISVSKNAVKFNRTSIYVFVLGLVALTGAVVILLTIS